MTLSKTTAALFGVVYALVGLAGFAVTGFGGTGTLLTFNLSVLDNIIHLVIGVAGLAAYALGHAAARRFCQAGGIVAGLMALLGVVVSNLLGVLPVGGTDVVLHGVTALVLLYVGFAGSPETPGG
jgi:hypothetical protein